MTLSGYTKVIVLAYNLPAVNDCHRIVTYNGPAGIARGFIYFRRSKLNVNRFLGAAALLGCAAMSDSAFSAGADESAPPAEINADFVKDLRSWLEVPVVRLTVERRNERFANLAQSDIDALDKQWRAETNATDQPLITAVLAHPLSTYLTQIQGGSVGLYTEIFVMDAKGLNVGQSDVTSDYWQGDEAKWKETFLKGKGAVHVGDLEQDESTQQLQSQVSVPVTDPATGENIGAVTFGVNVDKL